jgi:hypothetical protein
MPTAVSADPTPLFVQAHSALLCAWRCGLRKLLRVSMGRQASRDRNIPELNPRMNFVGSARQGRAAAQYH